MTDTFMTIVLNLMQLFRTFRALLSNNYMIMNIQNAECSHFFDPLGIFRRCGVLFFYYYFLNKTDPSWNLVVSESSDLIVLYKLVFNFNFLVVTTVVRQPGHICTARYHEIVRIC